MRAKCSICTGQLVFCGLCAPYCIKVTGETINTIGCYAAKKPRLCPRIFCRGLDRFASYMQEFMTHRGTVEIHSLTPPTSADAADSLPARIPHRKETHSLNRKKAQDHLFTQTQLDTLSLMTRLDSIYALIAVLYPPRKRTLHGYHHERERMRFQVQC